MEKYQVKSEILDFWSIMKGKVPELISWESDFENEMDKYHDEIEKQIHSRFEPLIEILNEGIQWLTNLYNLLEICVETTNELSDQLKIFLAFAGSACVYASAIRKLVLSGHDGPAKNVLRSFSDILNSCIVLCPDRNLSRDFISCHEDEDVLKFWYKNLSPKKLNERLSKIESELVDNDEFVVAFHKRRTEAGKQYSSFTHPCYQSALICVFPPSIDDVSERLSGIHGAASALLFGTLKDTNELIWYFSIMGGMMAKKIVMPSVEKMKSEIASKKKSEITKLYASIEMGASLFSELISKFWDLDYHAYMATT